MKWLGKNWKRLAVLVGGLLTASQGKPPQNWQEAAAWAGAVATGLAIPSGSFRKADPLAERRRSTD